MIVNAQMLISPLFGLIGLASQLGQGGEALLRVVVHVIAFLVWAGGLAGGVFLIHFLMTLPMRRAERARLFLDLLEDALNRGQSVEAMILSVAQSRDRVVGVRFHLLAAHIEGGLRFFEALDRVPRFLPPQVASMLRAGDRLGDLRGVLPACREILRDRPAGVRSAVHYMLLVVLFFSPAFVFVVTLTMTFVVPRFKEVAAGEHVALWPVTQFVFANTLWLIDLEIVLFLFLAAVSVLYIGGPPFARWFQLRGFPAADWVAWRVPWKQKRLQRTFSAMLAVLLDAGVPEAEAVGLAGECTANAICRHRAGRVVAALRQGARLADAVRALDDRGEFRWRLAGAARARGGFLGALRGWHDSLDARAFQQEEAAAHTLTTGIVILNGFLVALIATGMFGVLVAILDGMLAST